MLEQLIESKKSSENKRRGGFLATTFVLVASLAFSGVLWSLFAKDFQMGTSSFELSEILAPVAPPENAPPAPKPQRQIAQAVNNLPTRQANILRIEESPIAPTTISTAKNNQKSRPNSPFVLSNNRETEFQSGAVDPNARGTSGDISGVGGNNNTDDNSSAVKNLPPPPPPLKKADPPVEKLPVSAAPKSLGVINGKASFLPKPPYPAMAKAVNAMGEVSVQVTIDESGSVISAKAVSGHPLLKSVSETAARSAKFTPTYLSGQPVKITGIIVYKFMK